MRDILPALSVVITERALRHSQEISAECKLTDAPVPTSPTVRNTFRLICDTDQHLRDEPLRYGQFFRLECIDTSDTIYAVHLTFETRKSDQFNLPVGLIKKSDIGSGLMMMMPAAYANWFCQLHMNAPQRFEPEGQPITTEKSVVITHQATNKNLTATSANIQTLFGQEFLICAQSYSDPFNRTSWQNIWMDAQQWTQYIIEVKESTTT